METINFSSPHPIGVNPIYSHLAGKAEIVNARKVIITASLMVTGLLIASALFGQQLLAFFDVGVDDFRIAGGMLALLSRLKCSRRITAI